VNKQQFLAALREKINSLPQADINRSLDYYAEMIDDRIEDGISEEDAVSALGSVEDIASQILGDASVSAKAEPIKEPDAAPSVTKNNSGWAIFLIVLGSPVWIPIIIALLAIVLSVLIVLWSVVISFWAVFLAIALSAVVLVVAGIVLALTLHPVSAAVCVGTGFVCGGVSILLFLLFRAVTIGIVWMCKGIFRGIKAMFSRRKAG